MHFNCVCMILLSFSKIVSSCTHRQARARIINRTGAKIESLALVHKYSDNYKNSMRFYNIDDNSHTDTYLTVDYHAGFMCIGKDWWWLSWSNSKDHMYTIAPKNGRCFIDHLERLVRQVGNIVGVKDMRTAVLNQLLQLATNDESTCGFKQHMLESDDEGTYVDITLYSYTNNGIEFKSPSGKSTTDYEYRRFPIKHDEH